ncbi:hypothetical protein L873DRAFT_1788070 [Choiromyces venosus 120613-1]|uniref:Uncharacterized protein n=1 Tax=Choiromyces venosus 120613-1 TaxID=1336337 RepID=A0A3N4JY02_9PEZI|nr:hypothetical protein L873DRAFT_1788070 [Choiromyces venosus 120613-1]
MIPGTNKQASVSHRNLSRDFRSINIEELWAHDQRHVSNTGSRGSAYCSSLLGPGRGSEATSISCIEDCTEGKNEVKVVLEDTTQGMTDAQKTGGLGCISLLAVYSGLSWKDSLVMLNWRLQAAYAEKYESSTNATDAKNSSSVQPAAMRGDVSEEFFETITQEAAVPEAISERAVAKEVVEERSTGFLEHEHCSSIPTLDGSNSSEDHSESLINSQKTNVSVPAPESPVSESASSSRSSPRPPGDIYFGLDWTGSPKIPNRNLQNDCEKNDAGCTETFPINTGSPQINFHAEDPPAFPPRLPIYSPGLPIPTPGVSPQFDSMVQQPSLQYKQEGYPMREPSWGPYPYFSQLQRSIPHHLFCPSAAHAAACGGIFTDPRTIAAIDYTVYHSALSMFENFRRQYLAMEGGSGIDIEPATPASVMLDSSTQAPTEPVQNALGLKKTSTASPQTEIIEIASTRDFGTRTHVLEDIDTNKTLGSRAQILAIKTSSIGTSTKIGGLPVHSHPVTEAESQPQPRPIKKRRYKKKAKSQVSEVGPPPPPCPTLPTVPCKVLSIHGQTTTSIATEKVKKNLIRTIHPTSYMN